MGLVLAEFTGVSVDSLSGTPVAGGGTPIWSWWSLVRASYWMWWVLLLLGALLVLLAIFWKRRSNDQRLCPKCWYDMSATEGMTCPECGRSQRSEKKFGKRRRSRRLVAIGCVLFALSYTAYKAPMIMHNGVAGIVPRTLLFVLTLPAETPTELQVSNYYFDRGNTFAKPPAAEKPMTYLQKLWVVTHSMSDFRRPMYGWQYAMMRNELVRRERRGGVPESLFVHFSMTAHERMKRDQKMASVLLERSLTPYRLSVDGSYIDCTFGMLMFYLDTHGIELNGAAVVTVRKNLNPTKAERAIYPGPWRQEWPGTSMSKTGNGPWVPGVTIRVPLAGEDRGLVFAKISSPDFVELPDGVEREFTVEFRLRDELLEEAEAMTPGVPVTLNPYAPR